MAKLRASAFGLAIALALLAAFATNALAATSAWVVTASRSSVPLGVPTQVTLTVPGPPLDRHGEVFSCIAIGIPSVYSESASSYSDSRGYSWSVSFYEGYLVARAGQNNHGLASPSDHLSLRVTVTGKALGRADWSAYALQENDCKHQWTSGPAIPMSVSGSGPTPTPKPTPKPTARPKPTPTPKPTLTPKSPSTPQLTPKPTPGTASPSAPAQSPSPSALAQAGGLAGGGSGPAGGGTTTGPLESPAIQLPPLRDDATISFGTSAFSSGFGAFAWTVPGFLLGLPGLLVLLIMGAQTGSVALIAPIARRVLGNRSPRPGVGSPDQHHARVSRRP